MDEPIYIEKLCNIIDNCTVYFLNNKYLFYNKDIKTKFFMIVNFNREGIY